MLHQSLQPTQPCSYNPVLWPLTLCMCVRAAYVCLVVVVVKDWVVPTDEVMHCLCFQKKCLQMPVCLCSCALPSTTSGGCCGLSSSSTVHRKSQKSGSRAQSQLRLSRNSLQIMCCSLSSMRAASAVINNPILFASTSLMCLEQQRQNVDLIWYDVDYVNNILKISLFFFLFTEWTASLLVDISRYPVFLFLDPEWVNLDGFAVLGGAPVSNLSAGKPNQRASLPTLHDNGLKARRIVLNSLSSGNNHPFLYPLTWFFPTGWIKGNTHLSLTPTFLSI